MCRCASDRSCTWRACWLDFIASFSFPSLIGWSAVWFTCTAQRGLSNVNWWKNLPNDWRRADDDSRQRQVADCWARRAELFKAEVVQRPERVGKWCLHRFFFFVCFGFFFDLKRSFIQKQLTYLLLTGVMASAVSRSWSTWLWTSSAGSAKPDEDRWEASC